MLQCLGLDLEFQLSGERKDNLGYEVSKRVGLTRITLTISSDVGGMSGGQRHTMVRLTVTYYALKLLPFLFHLAFFFHFWLLCC